MGEGRLSFAASGVPFVERRIENVPEMDEALHVIKTPRLWPEWPYLRLERRLELRPGSYFCVLVADELHRVEPVVYLSDAWPPGDYFTPDPESAIVYDSLESVRNEGWRPSYLLGS